MTQIVQQFTVRAQARCTHTHVVSESPQIIRTDINLRSSIPLYDADVLYVAGKGFVQAHWLQTLSH